MPDSFQAEPPRRSSIRPSPYDRFTAVNFRKQKNDPSTRFWARVIAVLIGGGLVTLFLGMIWWQEPATPAVKVHASDLPARLQHIDTGDKVVIRAEDRVAEEKKEPTNKEKIVGTWELVNTAGGFTAGSTFEFTKDGKLKINFKGENARRDESAYTVDGDTISFSSSDGVERDKKKIKKLNDTELIIEIFEFKKK